MHLSLIALVFCIGCRAAPQVAPTEPIGTASAPANPTYAPVSGRHDEVVRVVPLRHGHAADVANRLNEIADFVFESDNNRTTGFCALYTPGDEPRPLSRPFRAEPDAHASSLVVHVRADWLSRVVEIIHGLDNAS
jgi:hypothetical protein